MIGSWTSDDGPTPEASGAKGENGAPCPHTQSVSNQTREYRVGTVRKLVNRLMTMLIRLGAGPRNNYLLTTVGRRTGVPHTTPVTLVQTTEGRWLVAPYGTVSWVHNARAASRVTLRRGRRTENCAVIEERAAEAAPVLKAYLQNVKIVRPFFQSTADSSLEELAREAPQHPVFRLGHPG